MTVIVNVEQETGDMGEYGKPILDWLDSEPREYGARMIVPGGSVEFSFTPDGRTVSAETRSAEIRGFYERIEKEKNLKDKWELAAIHKAQENSKLRSKLDIYAEAIELYVSLVVIESPEDAELLDRAQELIKRLENMNEQG